MSAPHADAPGLPLRIARRFVDVRPGEGATLLLGTLGFFCVLASYFVLKPLRDEIGIARGTENLPWLWTGTLGVTLLLAPLFAWLVSRYPRRTFLPATYRFFALNLVVFVVLARVLHGDALLWTKYAFYFWVSAFNMFVVSVWWAFMADLFRLEQSRRVFGCIAVGGTLGAIVGAAVTKSLVGEIGSFGLMLCSLGLLESAAQIARVLAKRSDAQDETLRAGAEAAPRERATTAPTSGSAAAQAAKPRGNAWSGLQRVATSPYLRAIGLYIVLQTLASGFLNLQLNQLVHDAKSGAVDRTAAFADRDLWTQGLTLALQIFVTGRAIPYLGVSATLVIQPFVAIAGFTLLAWALPDEAAPGGGFPADDARLEFALWTVIVFEALFRATQNGFARPARETLFTVVDREDKYAAKSVLDTFVLRGGDVLFAWVFRLLRTEAALPAALVASAVIPFAGGWLVLSWFLGRMQQRLAGEREPA
ncbi:MAG: MFS transporter [Planctomycetes bacterium]|nr:MFS transporter [Planctomycetota bacterium]